MSFRFDYQKGTWVLVTQDGSTSSGTTTTTTPKSTTTTVPPSTSTSTTVPTTTVKPAITVPTSGIKANTTANLDQIVAGINDQANIIFEQTGTFPNQSWYTTQLLPVQNWLNTQQATREAAAANAKIISERVYEDRVRAEENKREDAYRAAQLALSKAAAGSAAAARAQERLDALAKEKRDRKFQLDQENRQNQFQIDAENRAAARQDALEAVARVRGIEGGNAAANLLESAAGKRTLEGLARIKELYDPMEQMTNNEFATQIQLLAEDFKTARGQVAGAEEDFLKNFVNSVAYQNVPITTLEAPTNPLLAALQSQGAGTGEVQAVSDFAKQFATSTSDLGKWAASQLNVGQQNFDIAAQRAARGGTAAALQGLAGQEPRIKAGMQADVNRRLQEIAMQRAQAQEGVYNRQAQQEDAANALRAETLAKYGTIQETKKPEEPKTGDEAAKAAEAARKKAEEEARKAGIAQAIAARKTEF
jgi:hypothetical protein